MHPEQIKADIRMRGTTPAALADDLHVSRMTVSNVIHSRITSRRVAEAIAKTIDKTVSQVWPGRYETARSNSLRRKAK
ncbi:MULTISPECIES: helix-turn-helix domain-containing protein [unclassified Variovorax]|uniref:helix-turn-helix domain-containing protein n=1 Tax=unclassified Variovorax TaxID=663243 RepID=UPI003F455A8C